MVSREPRHCPQARERGCGCGCGWGWGEKRPSGRAGEPADRDGPPGTGGPGVGPPAFVVICAHLLLGVPAAVPSGREGAACRVCVEAGEERERCVWVLVEGNTIILVVEFARHRLGD